MDMEKIIKGLEHCDLGGFDCYEYECPYYQIHACTDELKYDILDLLKKQEPITIKKTMEHGFGVYGGICPKCRNWIQSAHSFCGFCGQAVKWNENISIMEKEHANN